MDTTRTQSSRFPEASESEWLAIGYTLMGIACFSLTFPMTRLALAAFDPILIGLVRGAAAGSLAAAYLLVTKAGVPPPRLLARMFGAGLGIVVVFPLMISIALKYVPATHAAVLAGMLPLFTAMFGVLRGREVLSRRFWLFAFLGTLVVLGYSAWRSRLSKIDPADLLILSAYLACAFGYAEGGLVARKLGSWPVICWILVVVLPLEVPALIGWLSIRTWTPGTPAWTAWAGLTYVSLISQWLGFFFYYRGLALGGVAKMSQLQLLLPFLSIVASGVILGEQVELVTWATVGVVTAFVWAGRKATV